MAAAAGRQARPGWLILLQPRWLCWHAFAVAATAGMLWLGRWQLHRAESGNELSWAYTIEWPLFAIFGLLFWARSLREELRSEGEPPDGQTVLTTAGRSDPAAAGQVADPEAGQADAAAAHLARLEAEVRGHGRWHGWR
jgi:hypothetical protein